MGILPLIFIVNLILVSAETEEPTKEQGPKNVKARQMEYISLINVLLQQTNLLKSVDGVLVAFTTVLAALLKKFKPFLIASTFSYFIYVATAIFMPVPLERMGLPTMDNWNMKSGRSVDTNKFFDGLLGETLVRSITISPVKNVITNVSVNVISDTMSRIRMISRIAVKQLSVLQGYMVGFSRAMSNECVSRFLCRVGQFTDTNFPMAASFIRTLADTFPSMDDYAVAVVRGTSSSNCSIIYPDCTL